MHQKMSMVIKSLIKTLEKELAFLKNYQNLSCGFAYNTYITYECIK